MVFYYFLFVYISKSKYPYTFRVVHYSLVGSMGLRWSLEDCWWPSKLQAILDHTQDHLMSQVSQEHPQSLSHVK